MTKNGEDQPHKYHINRDVLRKVQVRKQQRIDHDRLYEIIKGIMMGGQ